MMLRGPVRRAVAIVTALAALFTTAGASDTLSRDLERTNQELAQRRAQLEGLGDRVGDARGDLNAADHELRLAEAELAARQEALAAAQAELATAETRLEEAQRELDHVLARLRRTEATLAHKERTFDARIAATYKYGTLPYAAALMGSESMTDFVNGAYYVQSVLDNDRYIVQEVAALVRQADADRATADTVRSSAAEERRTAATARDAVERLVAEQASLTERVAKIRAQRASALAGLQADATAAGRAVAELEAASRALEEKLRESRWRAGAPGAGTFVWPTDGAVGSGYGYRTHPISGQRRLHAGIDIAGPTGQAIVAVQEGLVVHADWYGGYGLTVIVDHGGGVATLYAHQSVVTVRPGEVVARGERVGSIGSTGYSTGPHLHFEVRVNGTPQDPMRWY